MLRDCYATELGERKLSAWDTEFCRHPPSRLDANQKEQAKAGEKEIQTQKNLCLQLYTQSWGSEGYLPGNKGLCRDGR